MITLTAVYLHTIDPYAVKLWDGGPVRWYGLSYLVGFLIAYRLLRRVARSGRSVLEPTAVGDFLVTLAIAIVVGGRLGYVLFYRPEMLWTFSDGLPYWDLLAINKGGMASHGGMIGAAVAIGWYARRRQHSSCGAMHLLDLVAFVTPPGLFVGRIANFINGELIGRPCRESLPWAVKFPQEMFAWSDQRLNHLFGVVHTPMQRVDTRWGSFEPHVPQIIEQIQAGNQQVIRLVEPLLVARHPSQVYQALLEGLLLFVLLAIVWVRPRRPGVLTASFCFAYGLLRIVGELFRQPDAHIGFQWLGLTRGQWLSGLLLGLGLIASVWAVRSRCDPMGGWRAPRPTAAGESACGV